MPVLAGPVYANATDNLSPTEYIMVDNLLPLPDGQLGSAYASRGAVYPGCYRANEPGGLDYEIHPREFPMNDLLQLAHAVDCLIAKTSAETMLARHQYIVAQANARRGHRRGLARRAGSRRVGL
jgi:hypothetical protein